MKTERMVLLITPDEKARIGTEAGKLGISASEYVRKLVRLLDAGDIAELESVSALVPALGQTIENMETNIAATMARFDEAERERAYRQTNEYREKIRGEVLADPTINWNAVRQLFGGRGDAMEAAE